MKPLRDPEGEELKHLKAVCDLTGKTVLEIGCGDGRFSRQYARLARRVVGIDSALSDLIVANEGVRRKKSFYLQGQGERLPFPNQAFDLAIFASSL
jgi:ubiquinone/menaquinone biosynthesis C-methylase UbiE